MRHAGLSVAAFMLVLTAPALATGNVRMQQSDGSVQTYTGVGMKIANKTLTLTSADKVSTVVISGADCAHDGDIVRCTGGGFSLIQDAKRHAVPFKSATFYINPTGQNRPLPHSTTMLPSHSVDFVIQTAKGTHITGNGKLDQEPAR